MPSLTRSTTSSNWARVRSRVGRGPAHQVEQLVRPPFPGRHLGHDLLGQDVEGQARRVDGVEPPAAHRGEQGGALDQLVAGQRVQAALGRAGPAVVGPADPLQEGGDAAGRADLAHQLDRADVDAELQRGRGHQGAQVAGPQAGLDPVPAVLGQAAVVGGDHVVAQALAELMGQPLGQPAGVDEHQGGAVLGHQGGDAVEDVRQLLGGRHRLQLAVGQLEAEVGVPLMADVDHGRQGAGRRPAAGRRSRSGAGSPTGRCACGRRSQSASSRSRVRARWDAPLVAGHGVDLVDDHRLDACASASRPRSPVTSRYSDSGVVTTKLGGRRTISDRSALVVSPVRTATRMSGGEKPSSAATAAISASGRSRFSAMSTARARSGDTYTTRAPTSTSSPASWAR